MPKSYRIRTSVGNSTQTDKTIKVQVDQDFDFLEILSLKLTQSDVYRSFCSDYGVVVGRVIANGGYGVPNAKVSVFVPIDAVDQNDPVISALYPYKNVTDKNEDGYRYNLLPYTPSYEGHAATGTFPTREDVLTRTEVLQIYEKYYKYTVKTNESGDYMIVGVPLGNQQVILDVDLSDMGCFSLRPTDLIRMNLGNPKQFDGNQFKNSPDLASLPQIVNQRKSISVSSFWGTGDVCDVGITRVDFDLRDSNITIEPTATFMGSIMTSNDSVMLKNNCKPSSEQGDLCGMIAGPGRILTVRQTINVNANGDPILEQYQLEQGGKVIDENGAFVVDVPMNLDYVTTNEFGELIFSDNPSVGIPTKGKYRFKVKTDEGEKEVSAIQTSSSIIGPNLLNLSAFNPKGSLLRGNFLVPNIKEYGWDGGTDPSTLDATSSLQIIFQDSTKITETQTFSFGANTALLLSSITGEYKNVSYKINNVVDTSKWVDLPNGGTLEITVEKKTTTNVVDGKVEETPQVVTLNFTNYNYKYSLFQRSYSFSLDWDDYPNKNDAINCQDFFYEFNYNKVYTTAQLIDEYRKGTNRSRFLSIKEILDRSCDSEVNKFPINDGVRNFDLLYLIISILMLIVGITGSILTIVYSIVKFLWNNFAVYIAAFFISYSIYRVTSSGFVIAGLINLGGPVVGAIIREVLEAAVWLAVGALTTIFFKQITSFKFSPFRLPMITYPDCSTCDCDPFDFGDAPSEGEFNTSILANINQPSYFAPYNPNDNNGYVNSLKNQGYGQVVAGRDDFDDKGLSAREARYTYRYNEYWVADANNSGDGYGLPLPERVNLYNTKGHYFKNLKGGTNRIKVYPNYTGNTTSAFYEDQPLIVLCDSGTLASYTAGTLVTFTSPTKDRDINITGVTKTQNDIGTFGVTGTTDLPGEKTINIQYANPNGGNDIPMSFKIQQSLYTCISTTIVNNNDVDVEIQYISCQGEQETIIVGAGITRVIYNQYGSITKEKRSQLNKVTFTDSTVCYAPYIFPTDIEYYQVVTGYTLNDLETIIGTKTITEDSFYRRVVRGVTNVGYGLRDEENERVIKYSQDDGVTVPLNYIPVEDRNNLVVLFLMKGVDPYSPRQLTKIDVSVPLGLPENSVVVEGRYKLNEPIKLGSTLPVYSGFTNNSTAPIYYQSKFFTPATGSGLWKFSAYTTYNHLLYSSYDGDNVSTGGSNNQYKTDKPDGYYNTEYTMGGSLMIRTLNKIDVAKDAKGSDGRSEDVGKYEFRRGVYNPTGSTMTISDNTKLVMRTDRLPRSDSFDNDFVLAQNKSFSTYLVSDNGSSSTVIASINSNTDFTRNDSADFENSYGSGTTSVMSSFSCPTIVPLGAYQQTPPNKMTLKPPTDPVYYTSGDPEYEIVQNGCYVLCDKDLAITSDLKSFAEWKSRFLMGFAICRNVFGMTFTNNWINGVLYMPGFQNDKIYPGIEVTNPTYVYCKEKIVFKEENNSFFYRSSPFNGLTFVGMENTQTDSDDRVLGNKYFLGNPTTIVDLGPKDNIIKNVCAQPEFQGYVIDRLKATSFQGISDLIQFFIVSRLANANFLEQILGRKDSSISELFSRPSEKIDGDFAQLNSINNEIGVVPFSPESYSENQLFFGATPKPVVGVFFSSDTTTRDFISPGRETFIDTSTKFGYNTFGHKTQQVPMYQWQIYTGATVYPPFFPNQIIPPTTSIFGGEKNNWLTSPSDFYVTPYQGIDRLNDSTYFASDVKHPTGQRPGYIYNSTPLKDNNGNVTGFTYSGYAPSTVAASNKIIVGAPYHFYFGLKKGKTAFDIFLTKNLINI
jgi:hypothetical protein